MANKLGEKIPYDTLNKIAKEKINNMENHYKLVEIIKKIEDVQNAIYIVLYIYYKSESISDAIIIHNDKKK